MPETLTLQVTQEDIDQGTPCSVGNCPIARAFARVMKIDPDKEFVSINGATASVYGSDLKLLDQYNLSIGAQWFIMHYDFGDKLVPTLVQLERRPKYAWVA